MIFNSYYRGKGKQDPSTFNDVATELKLPIGEILFIDDNAGNVERAQNAGMQALQYVDKDDFILKFRQLTGVRV